MSDIKQGSDQPARHVGEYGDAYQGAREELAIWKRRALEAEETVRQKDQIIDHLVLEAQGESRFGEPVIPAALAPAAVVPEKIPSKPFTTIDKGCKNYKAGWNACINEVARLNATPVTAAEREALRRDAERYRWLLDNADLMAWENMLRFADLEGAESIGKFIDAAIARQQEGAKP